METKKSIKEMTVREVLMTGEYRDEVQRVMDGEVFRQDKAAAEARKQKARLNRTPLDSLLEKGAWEAEKMTDYYACILDKSLVGFGATERAYIEMVCFEAFRRVIQRYKEQEGIEDNATKR